MKGTDLGGTYSKLFNGVFENVIQCTNVMVDASCRKETFNCLQLGVKDCKSIEESIEQYVAVEELVGSN